MRKKTMLGLFGAAARRVLEVNAASSVIRRRGFIGEAALTCGSAEVYFPRTKAGESRFACSFELGEEACDDFGVFLGEIGRLAGILFQVEQFRGVLHVLLPFLIRVSPSHDSALP